MLKPNVETFIACDSDYSDAEIVLYGAPFDGTTSYRPGARFGSAAIRHESYGLETYSPYLDCDLTDCCVTDVGDVELTIGDTAQVLRDIEEVAQTVFADGKIPFLLGGEHLVTLAPLRAAVKKHPNLHVVHFDAHADLRQDYLGNPLSHASVMRRAWELVGDGRIHQFGIRSGDREEFEWGARHVHTNKFTFDTLRETLDAIGGKPVYFTIDLDVLDPSVFCGTGTPEAGGVTFDELRRALTLVLGHANVIGMDAVELSPAYDASGVSTAVAGKLVREMILACLFKNKAAASK